MTVWCGLQGARRPLWAKLVILASTAVALATSAPPRWQASEARQLAVGLGDGGSRELQVTVALAGPLYADLGYAELMVSAITDRAATDLTLTLRRLEPSAAAGSAEASALSANPVLDAPDRASLVLPLLCAELERDERAESCREVFQVRVSRESRQATEVAVHAELRLVGSASERPSGTLELLLVEVTP